MAPPISPKPANPWIGRALLALLFVAVAASVWYASTQQATRTREAREISALIPFEPPPPPPPEPEPQPQDRPDPVETPSPQASDAPADAGDNTLTADAEAQAGAGGIQIGDGGGRRGAGRAGLGSYAGYLQGLIQRAVQSDPRFRGRSMRVRISVWVDAAGAITRVEIREGASGQEQALRGRILDVNGERSPPAGVLDVLPMNMTVSITPQS